MPVYIVRPEPGSTATLNAARAMGLEAHGFPLFEVRPLGWDAPPAASFDALLIGSANALRHGGAALAAYRGKPAYAVGAATADAARGAGLDVVAIGTGGLQGILPAIKPEHRHILRLAGRERVELTLPPGLRMSERVVYASEPLPMPTVFAEKLCNGGVVLLHSREAGLHFSAECDRLGIKRDGLTLAVIGPRVASAVGEGWAGVTSTASPDDQALLALASRMCQNNSGSIA